MFHRATILDTAMAQRIRPHTLKISSTSTLLWTVCFFGMLCLPFPQPLHNTQHVIARSTAKCHQASWFSAEPLSSAIAVRLELPKRSKAWDPTPSPACRSRNGLVEVVRTIRMDVDVGEYQEFQVGVVCQRVPGIHPGANPFVD